MLSSLDLESLIALKKRELNTEKSNLGLVAPEKSPIDLHETVQELDCDKHVQFLDQSENRVSNIKKYNAQDNGSVRRSIECTSPKEVSPKCVSDELTRPYNRINKIGNNTRVSLQKTVQDKTKANGLQDIKAGVQRSLGTLEGDTRNGGTHNGVEGNGVNRRSENGDEDVEIPKDLERYIRRYLGLPVMLKAGEFSPNNPILREERPEGRDAFLGLGEYERRISTLRKLRQNDYKEYLQQQARKKQEEKLRLEQERREQEQRERAREQYLLQLERERDGHISERNSRIVNVGNYKNSYNQNLESRSEHARTNGNSNSNRCERDRVETGTQVEAGWHTIAVQTDESAFFGSTVPQQKSPVTRAERELSPRLGVEPGTTGRDSRTTQSYYSNLGRRRSHDDYYDPTSINPTSGNELRGTYMPSIFDADAIHVRNIKAQQEAAAKRTSYQQELKAQIEEQQRIREERKARERMLEQAEMRRLEDQLRMLRMAQDQEADRNQQIIVNMRENARDYERKRTTLQREIDREKQSLFQTRKSNHHSIKRLLASKSIDNTSYSHLSKNFNIKKLPFSSNIPDNSVFSPNYDVDSYLRKNLNPSTQSLICDGLKNAYKIPSSILSKSCLDLPKNLNGECSKKFENEYECIDGRNVIVDQALVHNDGSASKTDVNLSKSDLNSSKSDVNASKNDRPSYEPSFLRKTLNELIVDTPDETLPIPVLRHSPAIRTRIAENDINLSKNDVNSSKNDGNLSKNDVNSFKNDDLSADSSAVSEAMRRLEDKWKVPIVQKNILKTLPTSEGRGTNILTQLGSIRRQLQLEQLKLDRMTKITK